MLDIFTYLVMFFFGNICIKRWWKINGLFAIPRESKWQLMSKELVLVLNCHLCKYSVYFPLYPCFLPLLSQNSHKIENWTSNKSKLLFKARFTFLIVRLAWKSNHFMLLKFHTLGKQTEGDVSQLNYLCLRVTSYVMDSQCCLFSTITIK